MTRRIVLRIANCEGVSERRPADEAKAALTKPGEHGLPDVVLFSEVSWLNLSLLARLNTPDFRTLQMGNPGDPDAGVAIASRDPLRKPSLAIGSERTSEGGGIRMRPMIGARTYGTPFTGVHPPPPRSPIARLRYIARARTRRGIVGGDWNQDPKWMRRTSLRKYRGIGVLGVLIPRHIKAGKATSVDIGSDHLAVDVPLWIPERRRA